MTSVISDRIRKEMRRQLMFIAKSYYPVDNQCWFGTVVEFELGTRQRVPK